MGDVSHSAAQPAGTGRVSFGNRLAYRTVNSLSTSLSEEEQKFLYNLEVLGLTQQRSAELAGLTASPTNVLKKPDVLAARETIRAATRVRVEITKEDVIVGIKKAVDQADLICDPMAQIAGWREISKMLGYDAPREINITITGDIKQTRRQIAQLNDGDLIQLLGADNVIDSDFYVVKEHAG